MKRIILPLYMKTWIISALCLSLVIHKLEAQSNGYNYFYRVYFRDKGANTTTSFSPSELLSERAINRREKTGIIFPDYRDLPVWYEYIDGIKAMGYTMHCTSKWINTALFKTTGLANYELLLNIPYVADIKVVKKPSVKSIHSDKLDFTSEQADLPPFDRPLSMINGNIIHNSGFTGKGILIAVLDGGFLYTDQISSLNNLRNREGIKATRDFVSNDEYVYEKHTHGTAVMSVLAGQTTDVIQGTAPGADYILLRTEDVETESSAEEDFWVAGAEYADSAGADIISSSLGYCIFDDAASSYKFSDIDGNTAFVTRAADIAASKGILVVNSAGNERTKEWLRIIAPSDGDSVIAVGAVDGNGTISNFSSAGPSFDRRIKPDNSTMGVSVTVQASLAGVSRSNGTSFSCPVLSGMAACLIQAVPGATNYEILDAIHKAADRFFSPDSLYGYGIPDMTKALDILQDIHLTIPGNGTVLRPNPTSGDFEIVFGEQPEIIYLEIFTPSGVKVLSKNLGKVAGRSIRISDLNCLGQGLYIVRLKTNIGIFVYKVIKLRN